MPNRETVEADTTLEPRDSRHQQQLEQHGVCADQAGELARSGRESTGAARVREAAVTQPEAGDYDGVGDDDHPHGPRVIGRARAS